MSTLDADDSTPELQGFAPDQMVACEECLRTNPPTRVNCLYCAAVLPQNEFTQNLQKPALRRLEKWELGYNNILLSGRANASPVDDSRLKAAADVVKLSVEDFTRIVSANLPLPLARAATPDESVLVERRLRELGFETRVVADADLGVTENGQLRIRALELGDDYLGAFPSPESAPIHMDWSSLILLVMGRINSTRVELKEEKATRSENRILDASQFFADEVVFDFYSSSHASAFRVASNSFDFSCLGDRKKLVSVENMTTLVELFRERAANIQVDQSYNTVRKLLDPVWTMEQQNESAGWRRERPGKYSIGSVTAKNNESQFNRYSQLLRFLYLKAQQQQV